MLEDTTPGENYEYLISAAGKEPLGGGVSVGITTTLNNAYVAFEARPGPDWILCIISGGNLVAEDHLGAELDPRYPTAFTTIDRTASSSATLSDLSAIQYSSFDGAVTIDILNGVAGTAYNIGTLENPVNNIPDAITIANERGFEKFRIHGDLTLGAGDNVDGFEFEGHSPSKTSITILDAASVIGCEFKEATVNGTLDGNAVLERCVVNNLNYIEGSIENCTLIGIITLSGTKPTKIYNCFDGTPGYDNNPIIDCGGSGRGLTVGAFTGGIDIRNKTGSEIIDLNLLTGRIILQETVTNGTIYCRGIGRVIDNSTGTANVIDEALYIDDIKDLMNTIKDATLIKQGAIDSTSTTTIKFITTLTETTNSFWNRASLLFTSGQNAGQMRAIKNYSGITKQITLQTPLSFQPADGDTFSIIAGRKFLTPDVAELADAVVSEDIIKSIDKKTKLIPGLM
jgi:hypothetical protein